jgi:hypothetical protein
MVDFQDEVSMTGRPWCDCLALPGCSNRIFADGRKGTIEGWSMERKEETAERNKMFPTGLVQTGERDREKGRAGMERGLRVHNSEIIGSNGM